MLFAFLVPLLLLVILPDNAVVNLLFGNFRVLIFYIIVLPLIHYAEKMCLQRRRQQLLANSINDIDS